MVCVLLYPLSKNEYEMIKISRRLERQTSSEKKIELITVRDTITTYSDDENNAGEE